MKIYIKKQNIYVIMKFIKLSFLDLIIITYLILFLAYLNFLRQVI